MPKLVLFDVDATLVLTGGAGLRSMNRAFAELFAIPDAFADIAVAGRTDPAILKEALDRWGLTFDGHLLDRFRARYCACLRDEIERPGPRKGVMPGVRDLLAILARRPDVFPALLTGNFEEGARIKLEHFDLWRFFSCGAFGEDAADRNGLVTVAVARAAACGAPPTAPHDVLVVGDTPLDVACAAANGATAVAIATGRHDVGTLKAAGAQVVFRDLSETAAFLALLE